MLFKKELEDTKRLCEVKIHDILTDESGKYTDLQYIQNLQTLVKLKDTAEKKKAYAY
jgi:hypothetical protein